MSMDKLMAFRTAYLRSIAQAWADPEGFGHELLKHPTQVMQRCFAFTWPWDKVCKLTLLRPYRDIEEPPVWGRAIVEEAGVEPAVRWLHRRLPLLEWIHDQWVWSKNSGEGLTLHVPLSPPSSATNVKLQNMALADWYRQRSSLFSDDWGTPYYGAVPGSSWFVEHAGAQPGEVGTGSPAPDGGYVPASQDFASFKVVLVAAIAKAWGDKHFRDQIQIDAKSALSDIRSYELPWDLGISIRHDHHAIWHEPGSSQAAGNQGQSYWDTPTLHELKLLLPPRPTGKDGEDVACEPLALALYNAAGAQYPFTCCCDP